METQKAIEFLNGTLKGIDFVPKSPILKLVEDPRPFRFFYPFMKKESSGFFFDGNNFVLRLQPYYLINGKVSPKDYDYFFKECDKYEKSILDHIKKNLKDLGISFSSSVGKSRHNSGHRFIKIPFHEISKRF